MKAMFNTTSNDIMLKFHLISSDVHRKSIHSSRKSSSKRFGNKLCKGLGGFFHFKIHSEKPKASALSGHNLREKSHDSVENDTILSSCDSLNHLRKPAQKLISSQHVLSLTYGLLKFLWYTPVWSTELLPYRLHFQRRLTFAWP